MSVYADVAELATSLLASSSDNPDVPPYVRAVTQPMAAANTTLTASAQLLAACDALPRKRYRLNSAGNVMFRLRYDAFEDDARLLGNGASTRARSWSREVQRDAQHVCIANRDYAGVWVRRRDAGVYRLVMCADNNDDGGGGVEPEQTVAAVVLYVSATLDTLVLAPNTPSALISVPPVNAAGAPAASAVSWLVVSLDQRVQQMRRPALQAFNRALQGVLALLYEALAQQDKLIYERDPLNRVEHCIDVATLDALVSDATRRDAWLWLKHPELRELLIVLAREPSAAPLEDASLAYGRRLVCKSPVARVVEFRRVRNSRHTPDYLSWQHVMQRVIDNPAVPPVAHEMRSLQFCQLLVEFLGVLYDSTQPLYGLVDTMEFRYVPAHSNPRAIDDALLLELPTGDTRVYEQYAPPHNYVAAPMNYLCVALRSGHDAADATLASSYIAGVTQVHVLPECVVAGARAPSLLADGVVPPVYDSAARQALSLLDPQWYRSDSDIVRRYWCRVPLREATPATSQRSVLASLARRLTAEASASVGVFGVARSLSDDPVLVSAVDDVVSSGSVMFVCVEEVCDRLTLAQSLLLRDTRNTLVANTAPVMLVDEQERDSFASHRAGLPAIAAAALRGTTGAQLAAVMAHVNFVPRRVRYVLQYTPPPPPPSIVTPPAPLVWSFDNTWIAHEWDDHLKPVKQLVMDALAKQSALDSLLLQPAHVLQSEVDENVSVLDVVTAVYPRDSAHSDVFADVQKLVYNGKRSVWLAGWNFDRLLSALSRCFEREAILGGERSVMRVPILALCKRYERERARVALDSDTSHAETLEWLLADAAVNELSLRVQALWNVVRHNDAYEAVNFARTIEEIRLCDVDVRRLLLGYGAKLAPEQRELLTSWHTPELSAHVIAQLVRYDRTGAGVRTLVQAVGNAVANVFAAALLPAVRAALGATAVVLNNLQRQIVATLPPVLVSRSTNAAAAPPPPAAEELSDDEVDAIENHTAAAAQGEQEMLELFAQLFSVPLARTT